MTIYTLYQYTNIQNRKRYIGITNNPERRAKQHASGRGKAQAFYKAIQKYGIEAFEYKALAIFDDIGAIAYHEQAAIIKLKTLSPDGYNLARGTPGTVYCGPLSVETRARLSIAKKGKLGHKHSIETRAKMSIVQKGNKNWLGHKHNAETRAKMSIIKKGKSHSAETRAKISVARKGNPLSAEHRAKLSLAHKGKKRKPFSAEHRARLSIANKGKTLSAGTCAKISAVKKGQVPWNKGKKGIPWTLTQRMAHGFGWGRGTNCRQLTLGI